MKIVTRTCCDIIPKTIMLLMINTTKAFLGEDLLAHLYSSGDPKRLMEESGDAAAKREEMLRLHHACKEALKIIGDFSSGKVGAPTAPSITNDLLGMSMSGYNGSTYGGAPSSLSGMQRTSASNSIFNSNAPQHNSFSSSRPPVRNHGLTTSGRTVPPIPNRPARGNGMAPPLNNSAQNGNGISWKE